MHANNLFIAEEFQAQYDDVDGSLVSYSGPTMQVGETNAYIGLDLSVDDKPVMFLDKHSGDFTSGDLRALIPALQRVLHDMEQYENA